MDDWLVVSLDVVADWSVVDDWLVVGLDVVAVALSVLEEVSDLVVDRLDLLDVVLELVEALVIELLVEVVLGGNTNFLAKVVSLFGEVLDNVLALVDAGGAGVVLVLISVEVAVAVTEVGVLSVPDLMLELLVLKFEVSKLSGGMFELLLLVVVEDSSPLELLEVEWLLDLVDPDLSLDGGESNIDFLGGLFLDLVDLLDDLLLSDLDDFLDVDVLVDSVENWDLESLVDDDSLGDVLLSWDLDDGLDDVLSWVLGLDWHGDLVDSLYGDVDINVLVLLGDLVLWVVGVLVGDLLEVVLSVLDGRVVVDGLVLEDWLADVNWAEFASNDLGGVLVLLEDLDVDVNVLLEVDDDLLVLGNIKGLGDCGSVDVLDGLLDDVVRYNDFLDELVNLEMFVNMAVDGDVDDSLNMYVLLGLGVEGDLEWLLDVGVALLVGDFFDSLDHVDDNLFGFNDFFVTVDNDGPVDKLLFVDDSVLEWLDYEVLAVEVKGEGDFNLSVLGLESISVDGSLDFLVDDLLLDDDLLSDNLLWYIDDLLDESLDDFLSWNLNDLLNLDDIFDVVRDGSADNLLNFDLMVDLVDSWYLLLDGNDFLPLV